MEVFLLLDRTGSMTRRWEEAVSAINVYVDELRKAMGEDLITDTDRVTLAAFDRWRNGTDFRVLRDAIPLAQWTPLRVNEVTPRGDTPLLDAVVRIAALAEAKGSEKTVVVIMTDGEENASTEVTKAGAKAAMDRLKTRNWQVVFLGAEFDAFAEAGGIGIAAAATISASAGHYAQAMRATAQHTAVYSVLGESISYSAHDRRAAGEQDLTSKPPSEEK